MKEFLWAMAAAGSGSAGVQAAFLIGNSGPTAGSLGATLVVAFACICIVTYLEIRDKLRTEAKQ